MVNDYQIAHDLAVAKLCGSILPSEEMYKEYLQCYNEFVELIKANKQPTTGAKVEIFKRLF